jgi:hypothetical protein
MGQILQTDQTMGMLEDDAFRDHMKESLFLLTVFLHPLSSNGILLRKQGGD